ncbi:MAG: ferrochelatase [Bacteroidota bacterium]
MNQSALLLVNTGTPANTSIFAIARYLNQFLSDGRVITLPALLRHMLVKEIIVPFRSFKSRKMYKQIWTKQGSPFLLHSLDFQEQLSMLAENKFDVYLGMRYGEPSLQKAIKTIMDAQYKRLVVLPLYPQYASSTAGSAFELVLKRLSDSINIPDIQIVNSFYDHPAFIRPLSELIKCEKPEKYDHTFFSFHGLPVSHVHASHKGYTCQELGCKQELNDRNQYCYLAHCYATVRSLVAQLSLNKEQYSVGFQSRLSRNWIKPFSDKQIEKMGKNGIQKLLVVCPSFVADNLETLMEVDIEYKELFLENGGREFRRVPSLNSNQRWVEGVLQLADNLPK